MFKCHGCAGYAGRKCGPYASRVCMPGPQVPCEVSGRSNVVHRAYAAARACGRHDSCCMHHSCYYLCTHVVTYYVSLGCLQTLDAGPTAGADPVTQSMTHHFAPSTITYPSTIILRTSYGAFSRLGYPLCRLAWAWCAGHVAYQAAVVGQPHG